MGAACYCIEHWLFVIDCQYVRGLITTRELDFKIWEVEQYF